MRIVVCMKQVPNLEKIRIKPETREPDLAGVPYRLGDFDKNALEAAIRIKEAGEDVTVTVISVGSPKLQSTIKEALAIGADEAVIMTDRAFQGSDAMGSARALARAIEKLGDADLILLGEGSTDEYSGQVPPRLAELLSLPQVTYVRELELLDGKKIRAVRDLEDLLETVEAELPAVVSVTSELNEPRLIPLTAILKASRKPLLVWGPEEIGVSVEKVGSHAAAVTVLNNLAPAQKRKGINFEGDAAGAVAKLVAALQMEGSLGL